MLRRIGNIAATALLFSFSLNVSSSRGQKKDSTRVDSTIIITAPVDTGAVKVDTTGLAVSKRDTSAVKKKTTELDTIINYSADSVYFSVNGRITALERNAVVIYKEMKLSAGRITVDWDKRILTAEPIPDTLWRDSAAVEYEGAREFILTPPPTRNPLDSAYHLKSDFMLKPDTSAARTTLVIDTIRYIGYPRFIQGADEITGVRMTYNLKTKRGYIVEGDTEYGEGYYRGEKIKRVGDDVLNVGEGYFTTCELDTPHYHFYSKRMKMIVKDKVIAKPVVLYFGKVPAGIVPFAIFSSRSGRQSGIIVPSYGETAGQGRFFQDLGYYVAPSDYWDARLTLDFYERKGILLDGQGQYKKRYSLNGSLKGAYTRFSEFGGSMRRWDLLFNHSQVITPEANLMVDARFTSDNNFYRDYSANPRDRMERILRSNATYRQNFPSFGGSMSFNLNHEKNLDDNTSTSILPRANFRLGQRSIFPQAEGQDELYWHNKFYYSASSDYTNKFSTRATSLGPMKTLKQNILRNSYSLNTSQTLLSYLNFTPSLSVSQEFTDEQTKYRYDSEGDSIVAAKEDGVFVRHTFGLGAGLSTKLYGTFPAGIKNIIGFRHVMTPAVSFNYQPDFSDRFWGYYQYIEDDYGRVYKKDRFGGQFILGGTPSRKSASLGISLANLFQMKRLKGEEAEKLDLFTLNFGTSYNLIADSLNWGSLSTSFRAEPIRGTMVGPVRSMSVNLTTTHSPYSTAPDGRLIDRFYFEGGNLSRGKLLRLTDFSLNTDFSLAPPAKKKADKTMSAGLVEGAEDTAFGEADILDVPPVEDRDRLGKYMDFQPANIPWDLRSSLRYSWSRPNPYIKARSNIWLENSLTVKLTEKWNISYTNRVDLVEGTIVVSGFTFYRDMHCWEGRFIWNISGVGQGFFLKINVKSTGLRDLKVEKRRGQGGFLGR